jgi:hypothetical protein
LIANAGKEGNQENQVMPDKPEKKEPKTRRVGQRETIVAGKK